MQRFGPTSQNFYPRPPRGGRLIGHILDPDILEFLSTPSAGRATKMGRRGKGVELFLSTPSAGRATAACHTGIPDRLDFYPRPPRGGRPEKACKTVYEVLFLSTPSAGRATGCCHAAGCRGRISIHALRGEGDLFRPNIWRGRIISIHALRGEGDLLFVYFVKRF